MGIVPICGNRPAIPGIPLARLWGDELPPDMDRRLELMRQQMLDSGEVDIFDKPHHYLTISGGALIQFLPI